MELRVGPLDESLGVARPPLDTLDEHVLDLQDRLWDLLPAAAYVCDADGTIRRFNRRAAELWGRTPALGDPAERYCGSFRLHRLDGGLLPHAQCPMVDVLRTGIPVRDQEVVMERPDGSRIVALANIDPIKNGAGRVLGAVNCFQDITARKRAESELRASRQDLEDFFENSVVPMHWIGADGTILRANQAELDLLGYAREEYVGRRIAEFHADSATIGDILARLSAGDRLEQYPARLRAKDGSIKHVIISCSARFQNGEFVGTRCVTLDMTAYRRSRAALRDSERRFRELLGALPVAIYTTDADGRITYYNEAAVEFSGRRPALGSDSWCVSWRLYRPDGTPMRHDECPMAVALKEGRPVRGVEAIAERPDGSRVPFIPYPTPLHDESGNLVGAVNMLVDVTERKQAERAAEQLASIIESSDDAIVSKDLNGVIASWNRGAERLFGYTAAEVIGQPITILIPSERREEETEILARIRRGERVDHFETVRRRKDGSLIDVSLTVSPVRDREGRITGASKIARDITERKRAEEQHDLLLREMSHRIKNLFTVTSGLVALSARFAQTPDDVVNAVRQRMRALAVAHDLTRPGLTGAGERQYENTTLDALARAVFAPYVTPEQGKEPESVSLSGPDVPLGGKAVASIALILHEFTTNAAKYGALSCRDGRVRVDWSIARDELVLTWREQNGPRLCEPPRESGFGSFFAERTVTGQFGGRLSRDWTPEGLTIHLAVPVAGLTH
jgi:PAS domain S-box-containing protein